MSKVRKESTGAEVETTVGRGRRETKVERTLPKYGTLRKVDTERDHVNESLRAYLRASCYYKGDDGRWYPKTWLEDTTRIKLWKISHYGPDPLTRLFLAFVSGLVAVGAFALSSLLLGVGVLSILVGLVVQVFGIVVVSRMSEKRDFQRARGGRESDIAAQFVGMGAFFGLMTGITLVVTFVAFWG